MVFFNDFFKGIEQAEHAVFKVARAPIDFALKPLNNVPFLRPLVKGVGILEDVAESVAVLPIKGIEAVIDNPELAVQAGGAIGQGLEVVGFITGQPELVALGAVVKGGAQVIGGIAGVGQSIRAKDLGGVIKGLGTVAQQVSALGVLEEQENLKLTNISNTLTQVGNVITDVDEQLGITNKLLGDEIKLDITNNEQIKQFIQENHGDNEALKHGQVILDNELKKLQTEELKEEDVLNQIRTTLDAPGNNFDFVKDIENFNNPKAILEYLAENLLQFEGLPAQQLDVILDLALSKGVLNAI